MPTGLSGGDSTCFCVRSSNFFDRSAKTLYFSINPLSRTAEAGSDAVSINMRRCSARAKQYSERSILDLSSCLTVQPDAFLKLYNIAQSQLAWDKWVNFAFRARLNSFATKQAPRPRSSRAAGSGETAQIKAFGDLLMSRDALKPQSNASVKLCELPSTTQMRCSTSRCCCKKKLVRGGDRLLAPLSCR